MTSAMKVPGGVMDQFKEFEGITGRPLKNSKDLRKIIPSIVVMELGYRDEATKILGHDSLNDITDEIGKVAGKHYISPVITEAGGTTTKQALTALQNLYGEVLGLDLLNDLPAEFNVPASSIDISKGGKTPRIAVLTAGEQFAGTSQVTGYVYS